MRFLPVSLTTILVELADLDETLALFASLQNDPVEGIEETVPAARTLMIDSAPRRSARKHWSHGFPAAISRQKSRLRTISWKSPSTIMAKISPTWPN